MLESIEGKGALWQELVDVDGSTEAAGIEITVGSPRSEADASPLSETATSQTTRPIAPDTSRASHRRLESI